MFEDKHDLDKPPSIFGEEIIDEDIISLKKQLNSLKKTDFSNLEVIEKIKPLINTAEELDCLKIFKLLYCLGFTKYSFLYAGIILESKLNNIAYLYINNNWKLHNFAKNDQNKFLKDEFIEKKSVGEKGNLVGAYNLFNDSTASGMISSKISSLSFLRNYGGHYRLNQFIESVVNDESLLKQEINVIINLLELIHKATDILTENHP